MLRNSPRAEWLARNCPESELLAVDKEPTVYLELAAGPPCNPKSLPSFAAASTQGGDLCVWHSNPGWRLAPTVMLNSRDPGRIKAA